MRELVRRGAVSRRDLLRSAAASAAVLSALSACSREDKARTGAPEPGGAYDVPGSTTTAGTAAPLPATSTTSTTSTTIDPEAASEQLDRTGRVIDVQLHFLDPERNDSSFAAGFPQSSCGEPDARLCYSQDHFLDLVFSQSDTAVGVLSGLPFADTDSPLALDVMERARAQLAALRNDHALLLQAPVFPATAPIGAVLDQMAADVATYPVAAWKTYTHTPNEYRLFDDRGDAMLAQAVALGRPIVSVHKGLAGQAAAASPSDVGPAAASHPDNVIVVYHSGYETSVAEGPYRADLPAGQLRGVDRLVASVRAANIGAGGNVYAELGSTWINLARDLDSAAHVLGKLLLSLGPERILWGTDSIWYGSPQGQIDAFRAFTISERFQERYGYPALTPEVKQKILGDNAARLYGIT